MKFVKVFARLVTFFVALTSFSVSTYLFSQEELLDLEDNPGGRPQTDGMFDDELEPLEEDDVIQPQSRDINPTQNDDFDPIIRNPIAPRPPPSSPQRHSTPGKTLPPLPGRTAMDIPKQNEKLRMDFVQVDIEEVVKYFAERLQKKFIYDSGTLTGKITIISPTEVTLEEAWGAFLSAMEVRGYVVFPAGPYLKIDKAVNGRKSTNPIYVDSTPNSDAYVTRILTLKYLSVNDIREVIRSMISRQGGSFIEHAPTNTVIISDYAYNIRKIVRILDILDVAGFQEQIVVIPLTNASASDVAAKVNQFFQGDTRTTSVRSTRATRTRAATGSEAQGVINKVVADDRTNALIVMGSERGIEQVKKFIEQIDVSVEGGGGQIHVYPLQNVKAEDISQTLAALAQSSASARRATRPTIPTSVQAGTTDTGPTSASLLNGDVKITADNATNSLVIQASPRDFDVLVGIIKKLDVRRRQVFIESAILEASVNKGTGFGTQYNSPFFRTDKLKGENGEKSGGILSIGSLGTSLESLLQNPSQLTGLALGFRSGGLISVPYQDANGTTQYRKLPLLSAVLLLSAKSENVNVLSTPHVLATANEEATISIGQEVPQLTGISESDAGKITKNITRIKVATELAITPQINAGDYLTLKIKQKINEVGAASADGQFNTINREASTTVIVKNEQTIVIGGLMEDRRTETISKVPLLGDIPILGWLFKSRGTNVRKVNLLLFLTPHIIRDTGDMNDTFFRKLKEREGFLKEIGMEEKKGVPISGLTEEQLKLLDEEYVKSLRREPLVPLTVVPETPEAPAHPEGSSPSADPTSLPTPKPKEEIPPRHYEPIPVIPLTPAPSEPVEISPDLPGEIEELAPTDAPVPPPPELEMPLEDSAPEENSAPINNEPSGPRKVL